MLARKRDHAGDSEPASCFAFAFTERPSFAKSQNDAANTASVSQPAYRVTDEDAAAVEIDDIGAVEDADAMCR